jgi:hypothetical protein
MKAQGARERERIEIQWSKGRPQYRKYDSRGILKNFSGLHHMLLHSITYIDE